VLCRWGGKDDVREERGLSSNPVGRRVGCACSNYLFWLADPLVPIAGSETKDPDL
jgi:hypothetical protein